VTPVPHHSIEAGQRSGRSLLQALALILLFVVALAPRLVDLHTVVDPPTPRLLDEQSHLNAWRMARALRHTPALPPARSPMLNHPRGAALRLPPGMPWLGGVAGRLAGLSPGAGMGRLGTLLMALFGALAAVASAWFAWRYVSLPWALLAGVMLALWPAHIEYTRVGRLTPEALQSLVTLLATMWGLRALRCRAMHVSVVGGLLLGSMVWLWSGALLPLLLLGLGLTLAASVSSPPTGLPWMLAVALAACLPLCLREPFRHTWSAMQPSVLHLVVLSGMLIVSLVGSWVRARMGPAPRLGLCIAALLLLVLLPVLLLGRESIVEPQQSLFDLRPAAIIVLLTHLALALPLLVWLANRMPLAPGPQREVMLLTLWAGALLLAGSAHPYLLPLALSFTAPLCALGVAEAARRLYAALSARARPALLRLVRPATGVGALCLMWPAADYLVEPRFRLAPPVDHAGVVQAALRLRGNPGLAVMAPLEATATLLDVARARVLALMPRRLDWSQDGQVQPPAPAHQVLDGANGVDATRDTATFFTLTDPRRAQQLLRRRRIQLVLVPPFSTVAHAGYRRLLGRGTQRIELFHFHRRTMAVRLFHDLGTGVQLRGEYLPAVHWLQHVWESRPRLEAQPTHLFRVVPGARLQGRVEPRALVQIRLPLVTGRGRPLEYADRRRADGQGRVAFRVPYWSSRTIPTPVGRYLRQLEDLRRRMARGERVLKPLAPLDRPTVTPLGPLRVTVDGTDLLLDISRRAVTTGGTIRFGSPPHQPGGRR